MRAVLVIGIVCSLLIGSSWSATKETSEDYKVRVAVKAYLCALRDLDATKFWALMSKDCQKRFTGIFTGLQKKTYTADSEIYYFPPLGKCKSSNEYFKKLFETQLNVLPDKCRMVKDLYSELKVVKLVRDADVIIHSDRACLEFIDTEVRGIINLVKEADGWKVDNALEFDPLGI